jgi:hypothetical protein
MLHIEDITQTWTIDQGQQRNENEKEDCGAREKVGTTNLRSEGEMTIEEDGD